MTVIYSAYDKTFSAAKNLLEENARLRIELLAKNVELEALKPKPAVTVIDYYAEVGSPILPIANWDEEYVTENLRLTFEDGHLVGAEVITTGEEK